MEDSWTPGTADSLFLSFFFSPTRKPAQAKKQRRVLSTKTFIRLSPALAARNLKRLMPGDL